MRKSILVRQGQDDFKLSYFNFEKSLKVVQKELGYEIYSSKIFIESSFYQKKWKCHMNDVLKDK